MTENKTMKQTKPLDVVDNLTEALKAVENVHGYAGGLAMIWLSPWRD